MKEHLRHLLPLLRHQLRKDRLRWIEGRAVKAPLGADNYAGLSANKGNLIYSSKPFYYGRSSDDRHPCGSFR